MSNDNGEDRPYEYGTKFAAIFGRLGEPFPPEEVKILKAKGNLRYITARQVMNRLDQALGPENWSDDYVAGPTGGVKCFLTIRLPDGTTVTKTGIGGVTQMHDASDTDKTGESDALKRAAVKFGVFREGYGDGIVDHETGEVVKPELPQAPRQGGNGYQGNGGGYQQPAPQRPQQQAPPQQNGNSGGNYGPPRSGKALYVWAKETAKQAGVGEWDVLNVIQGFTKRRFNKMRTNELTPEEVTETYEWASNNLEESARARGAQAEQGEPAGHF